MHMHEVELMPLGDTDVTTLGKWLSNHDNMAQCCILLGRAPRMASPSCRQDSDIPSARSAECPGDGSQPVVTEGHDCFLPSGLPVPLSCLEGQHVIYQAERSHLGAMGDSPKDRKSVV